jgi:hypothetical protein
VVALAVEFTLGFLILAPTCLFPCVSIPLLVVIVGVFGSRWRIAPKLSTRSPSDRVAWLAFLVGIWTMVVITAMALLGEGDGDFRTWDQVRRQVRILWAGGILGAGVPLLVTIWQHLRYRRSRKPTVTRDWSSPHRP